MKRGREEDQQTLDLVRSLMLLSENVISNLSTMKKQKKSERPFVCKTCNREFLSFQALGGHRGSHNKRKLVPDNGALDELATKAKKHACPICGVEFAMGQALGGHMRRHRDIIMRSAVADRGQEAAAVPVLKRSNSSKRVSGLNLDLNLAPPGYQCHMLI